MKVWSDARLAAPCGRGQATGWVKVPLLQEQPIVARRMCASCSEGGGGEVADAAQGARTLREGRWIVPVGPGCGAMGSPRERNTTR